MEILNIFRSICNNISFNVNTYVNNNLIRNSTDKLFIDIDTNFYE